MSQRYKTIADKFNLKSSSPGGNHIKSEMMLFLKDLKQHLGVDSTLSAQGLEEHDIPQLATNASKDACIFTNPKKASIKDIEILYEKSF